LEEKAAWQLRALKNAKQQATIIYRQQMQQVWTESRQHRGKAVAKDVALLCCASAAFDDNSSSVMPVQFCSVQSNKQQAGLYRRQLQQVSLTKSQQRRGRKVTMHITLPCCASAAFDDNSGSFMTVQFLFVGASDNQQAGLYRQQLQLPYEQHHSSAGGERRPRVSLGRVVPVHSMTVTAS